MKITVSRQELLAALVFASQDDSRYVLCGVNIEATPGSKPIMVTTDGRRLVVIETQAEQEEDLEEGHSLLLRADFVKAVCALSKAVGAKLFPWVTFDNKPGSKQITVAFVGGGCTLWSEGGALIEGEYPKWRQVVPPKNMVREPVNNLGLNAAFLGDFAKAAKIMGLDISIVQMHLVGQDKAVEVKIGSLENVYGIVMPCKPEENTEFQPEFLKIVEQLPAPITEQVVEPTE